LILETLEKTFAGFIYMRQEIIFVRAPQINIWMKKI